MRSICICVASMLMCVWSVGAHQSKVHLLAFGHHIRMVVHRQT